MSTRLYFMVTDFLTACLCGLTLLVMYREAIDPLGGIIVMALLLTTCWLRRLAQS